MVKVLVSQNDFYSLSTDEIVPGINIMHIILKRPPSSDEEFIEYEKAFVHMYTLASLFCLIVEFHGDLTDIEPKYIARKLSLITRMVTLSKKKIMCSGIVASQGDTINTVKKILQSRPPSTPYMFVPSYPAADAYVRKMIHSLTAPPEVRPVSKSETISLLMTMVYDLLEAFDDVTELSMEAVPASC